MNSSRGRWFILALMLGIGLMLAACGGNSSAPTSTRRAAAATRTRANTTGGTVKPTQDPSNDSDSAPADGPFPTQDPQDDSSDNSGTPKPTKLPKTPEASADGPKIENGQLVLSGTSWYEPAKDRLYQFCAKGRWELIQGGDTVEKSGTFELDGNALKMQENAGQPTSYQMNWNAGENTLTLNADQTSLKLEYDGESICSE